MNLGKPVNKMAYLGASWRLGKNSEPKLISMWQRYKYYIIKKILQSHLMRGATSHAASLVVKLRFMDSKTKLILSWDIFISISFLLVFQSQNLSQTGVSQYQLSSQIFLNLKQFATIFSLFTILESISDTYFFSLNIF